LVDLGFLGVDFWGVLHELRGGVEDPNSLKELWRGRRFGGGWG